MQSRDRTLRRVIIRLIIEYFLSALEDSITDIEPNTATSKIVADAVRMSVYYRLLP